MNALYTTDAEISRALFAYVVNPSGRRPFLEITTSSGRNFHFVEVNKWTILFRVDENGELTFVSFLGQQPIGRSYAFVWPPVGVEEPALGITEIEVYGQ